MKIKISLLTIAALLLTGLLWSGGNNDEKKKIISMVERFFKVLETRDGREAKKIVLPQGLSLSIREKKDGKKGEKLIKHRKFDTFAEQLAKGKEKFKEVMTNPKVLIHKELAVLWAPYKFYLDGKYSHKGVDAFTLVKTTGGWKIATVIYTVEFGEK